MSNLFLLITLNLSIIHLNLKATVYFFQNVPSIAHCVTMKQNALNVHRDTSLMTKWNVKVRHILHLGMSIVNEELKANGILHMSFP